MGKGKAWAWAEGASSSRKTRGEDAWMDRGGGRHETSAGPGSGGGRHARVEPARALPGVRPPARQVAWRVCDDTHPMCVHDFWRSCCCPSPIRRRRTRTHAGRAAGSRRSSDDTPTLSPSSSHVPSLPHRLRHTPSPSRDWLPPSRPLTSHCAAACPCRQRSRHGFTFFCLTSLTTRLLPSAT